MEKLYELALCCKRHRKILESILPNSGDSRIMSLYNILYSGRELNNFEAMVEIYGKRNSTAFSMLKERMYQALIKTISIQDPSYDSDNFRFKILLDGYRQYLAARILLINGHRPMSIYVVEKTLYHSLESQESLNVLEILRLLCTHYGTVEGNKYKLNKYLNLEDRSYKTFHAERVAVNGYVELKSENLQSVASVSDSLKRKADDYAKEISNIKDIRSRTFNFYRFRLLALKYEFKRDFIALLELCAEATVEFKEPDLNSASSLALIKQIEMWTLIQIGKFADCINLGLKEIKRNENGPINWYTSVHYTIKAMLYNGNYKKAIELVAKIVSHINYKRISENLKELGVINLGYIHLLINSDFTSEFKISAKSLPEFRLGKFLNTTRIYSKDKRGINVSILLLEIAFLLQRKKYDAIIDRTESLKAYAGRYLRNDDTFRSNCMIKMVLQMERAGFNLARTQRYTADLLKKLSQVKLEGSGTNIDVEVIPFEVLWAIMLKALEKGPSAR